MRAPITSERRTRPDWSTRLVAPSLAAVAVAGFAVARPGPFRATVTSPAALLRIVGIAAVFGLLSWALRAVVANAWARRALVGVPALLLLAVAVGPYFRDEEVVEQLATSAADLGADQPPAQAVPAGGGPATTATPTTATPTAATPTTATPTTAAPATTAPAVPVELSRGTLRGIDHRASGTASVFRLPDSTVFLRLEDIDIQSGPDYVLYLVPGRDQERPGRGVSLGALKANRGSQNYAIPAGTDLSGDFTVLVWCRAFSVPIAAATQDPA